MKSYKLSIIIPGRNEEFLGKTIEDVLSHTSDQTEIIAILDGYLPNPPLKPDPRITVIYNPVAVGQRGACNQGVKLSRSKYVLKLDAHCAVDENFDTKMIQAMDQLPENTTLIPVMRNLHIFDWVCPEGHRRYQSPSGVCETCKKPTVKEIVWIPKRSPATHSFRFDKTMHFQYFGEYSKRPEVQKGIEVNGVYNPDFRHTMSIQGSCFMTTKKMYLDLELNSEQFHSWGQQGVEIACKTWLSGGQVVVYMKTWYAHCFRTRGGDFGFPYHNPQDKVNENRELSRELFQRNKWPLAKRKFQWILDKFNPPDWGINKGVIYYTDNQLDEKIAKPVRDQLTKAVQGKNISITCSSLRKMDFGDRKVRFPTMKRGYTTMFKQILGALEKSSADIIFFTEHDVLYHPSHFDFTPPDKETFYYNQNVWYLREDGHAMHYDVNQLSGLCVWRETALIHFRERYERFLKEEFTRNTGFEPFTHHRVSWKNEFKMGTWKSEFPNVDIRFGVNATGMRWKKEQYRNQQLLINWIESETSIPGWENTKDLVKTLQ
jgi:glycosyltransferase involved in cell wall biosynthesis